MGSHTHKDGKLRRLLAWRARPATQADLTDIVADLRRLLAEERQEAAILREQWAAARHEAVLSGARLASAVLDAEARLATSVGLAEQALRNPFVRTDRVPQARRRRTDGVGWGFGGHHRPDSARCAGARHRRAGDRDGECGDGAAAERGGSSDGDRGGTMAGRRRVDHRNAAGGRGATRHRRRRRGAGGRGADACRPQFASIVGRIAGADRGAGVGCL